MNVDDSAETGKIKALVRELHLSFPILHGSDDVAGIYNILYRYLFDRHRDLGLPTSFLLNDQGDIVKVYQGTGKPGAGRTGFPTHSTDCGGTISESTALSRRYRHTRVSAQLSFVWFGFLSARLFRSGGSVIQIGPVATIHRAPRLSTAWGASI